LFQCAAAALLSGTSPPTCKKRASEPHMVVVSRHFTRSVAPLPGSQRRTIAALHWHAHLVTEKEAWRRHDQAMLCWRRRTGRLIYIHWSRLKQPTSAEPTCSCTAFATL
jgi:hypothetical protein